MDCARTPLEMLAATCNSIGQPDNPSKGRTILPLDCGPTSSSSGVKSIYSAEKSVNSKSSDCNHNSSSHLSASKLTSSSRKANSTPSSRTPSDTGSPKETLSLNDSKRSGGKSKDLSVSVRDHSGCSGSHSPGPDRSATVSKRSPPISSHCSGHTALPPTFFPANAASNSQTPASKCLGCLTPAMNASAMFPLFSPPGIAGGRGVHFPSPTVSAAISPTASSLYAAAVANAFPFLPMCRDPCCKSCPTMSSVSGTPGLLPGLGGSMTGGLTLSNGDRCPLGCSQCTSAGHAEFWLSTYPLLVAAAANGLNPGGISPAASNIPTLPMSLTNHHTALSSAVQPAPMSSSHYECISQPLPAAVTVPTSTSSTTSSASTNGLAAVSHSNGNCSNHGSSPSPESASNNSDKSLACHWVSPDSKMCGKKFANPDELVGHIRIAHMNLDAMQGPTLNGTSVASSTYPAPTTTAPTDQFLSPESLAGRFSPRSSYLSSLASLCALNRYHPYKQAPVSNAPTNPLSQFGLPPAALNPGMAASYPYFAASLYGQRLPNWLPRL